MRVLERSLSEEEFVVLVGARAMPTP